MINHSSDSENNSFPRGSTVSNRLIYTSRNRYHAENATDVERSSSIANQHNLTGGFSLSLLDGLLSPTTTALKHGCGS